MWRIVQLKCQVSSKEKKIWGRRKLTMYGQEKPKRRDTSETCVKMSVLCSNLTPVVVVDAVQDEKPRRQEERKAMNSF